MNADDHDRGTRAVDALREEIARLVERVAALEAAAAHHEAPPKNMAATNHSFGVPGADNELVVVISAAVAAYLGEKPRIRQIRLVGGSAWAQQGRVTIQASHALAVHHG